MFSAFRHFAHLGQVWGDPDDGGVVPPPPSGTPTYYIYGF